MNRAFIFITFFFTSISARREVVKQTSQMCCDNSSVFLRVMILECLKLLELLELLEILKFPLSLDKLVI